MNSLKNIIEVFQTPLMAKAEIGDHILIKKAGCNGLNGGINHFLSHQMPKELLENNEGIIVIRQRGKYEDLILNQGNI